MNRSRRRHCAVATTLAMTMGMYAGGAWGQAGSVSAQGQRTPTAAPAAGGTTPAASAGAATTPTPAPAVAAPVTISPATYANPGGGRAEIDNFINLNVQNLLNDGNVEAQGKAREVLVTATTTAGAPASPQFMFDYAASLNNAFSAKLGGKNKLSVRQRLNVAIVAAKVAYVANNTALRPTTELLLKDEAEPVVLWGIKAAQPQVPFILGMKGVKNLPLIPDIREAVFKHPSGPVFEEGYQALEGAHPVIADELMKLWQNRLTQYQTKVPQDPSADGRPAFKLSTAAMWTAAVNNPQAQQKVMQMIVDQLSAAAQWADQSAGDDTRAQLVALAQQCAAACSVIGGHQQKPELAAKGATAAGALVPKNFSPGTKVGPIVQPVVEQVLSSFKGVQQPPQVGPGPGATGVAQP